MENIFQEDYRILSSFKRVVGMEMLPVCAPSYLNAYLVLSKLEEAMGLGLSDYLIEFVDLSILEKNIELKNKYEMLEEELDSIIDDKRKEEIMKEMGEILDMERKGKYGEQNIYSFSELKKKGLKIWFQKKQV